jgi:nucleotide-binding universal stress UspA family protein
MTGQGSIVVGVDGSEVGRAALRWAVDEADRRGCGVDVVMAWHRDPGMVIGALPAGFASVWSAEGARAEQEQILDATVRQVLGGNEAVPVRQALIAGDPRAVLTEVSCGADVLVLGSHGANRVAQTLLGSVSAYCVRHATCPVVLIPDQRAADSASR